MKKPIFSTDQWLTIVGGLIIAGVSVTAFAFTTFEQKSDLRDLLVEITDRLTRIEQKVDKL